MTADTDIQIANDCDSGHSLDRMVLLRLSEIVTLVRCLRQKAYDCRYFAQETEHDDLRRQALNAARRLEERATQLSQENDKLSGGGATEQQQQTERTPRRPLE
jgi:hypothetical protein